MNYPSENAVRTIRYSTSEAGHVILLSLVIFPRSQP